MKKTATLLKKILSIAVVFGVVTTGWATTHEVTTNASSGAGSLPVIMTQIQDGDTITFNPSTNGTPIIFTSYYTTARDFVMIGNDTTNTIISGGGTTHMYRLTGEVEFNGVKFQDGLASQGGAIYVDNNGIVEFKDCMFQNNTATTGNGGAIYNFYLGKFSAYNCQFYKNTATAGGAIYIGFGPKDQTDITLDNCTFKENLATGTSGTRGGAIYAYGSDLTVSNCDFEENSAYGSGGPSGGAIYAYGTPTYDGRITIEESTFSSNRAEGDGTASGSNSSTGGALFFKTNVVPIVTNSIFYNNQCVGDVTGTAYGGAVYNDADSSITIYACEFENNLVTTQGSYYATAGAIFHQGENITIENSSFYDNQVIAPDYIAQGGAITTNSGGDDFTLINSTFYNNSTTGLTRSIGGALYLGTSGDYYIANNTIAGNSCIGGTSRSEGGGAYIERGTNWELYNNIFADNTAEIWGLDIVMNQSGFGVASTSTSANLVEDDYNYGYTSSWAYTSDPGMDPSGIQDNGGPTPTVAITNMASEAINNADATYAPTFDQRNATRNGNPDIGAYEVGGCVNTFATLTLFMCDTYTVPSGDESYTTSGIYIDTIMNTEGCDSILTINLTILNASTGTDIITACDSYTWIDGITYTSSNNTATHVLTNVAGCDSTVTLDLTINYSTSGTDVITSCDSYTWTDGNTYTTSGTYTQMLTNSVGCDSIVTLDLTINYSSTGIASHTTCDSYTWINGITYTSSNNTATYVLTNIAGCDSTVTLDLIILNSTASSITEVSCDTYTVPSGDETYTTSGIYYDTILNTVGCDSVITIDLTVNYSSASTTTMTVCDSYMWTDGNTYTTSGTYTQTLTNAVGCDSIATLDLTINNSTTGTDAITTCDSYTWIDGITYTSSNNTATHVLTNAAGCDSTVTLDLTINYSNTGTDMITACDSYTWIDGVTYTSSNSTATYVMTNIEGCDSTVTLDLTINYSSTGMDVITACDSYTWTDGNTYTSSGTYTQTLTNAVGCDSIVTLDLTINNSNTGTYVISTCSSYTWIDGNTYTSSNNTATYVLTNVAGCDSVVTLDLTINYPTSFTDVITACDSYTWIDGNTYTASNNSATTTLTSVAGCDSVVTLDLTINTVNTSTTTNLETITADESGATYQWIDCDNGNTAITGETNQSFTATTNGNYAVIVDNGLCTDTSACVSIQSTGIDAVITQQNEILIYPNPNNGSFNISFGNIVSGVIEILTLDGKQVHYQVFKQTDHLNLVVSHLETGVYILVAETSGGSKSINRVIIH